MAISGSYSQIPGLRLLIRCKGGFPLGLLLRPKSAYPRKRCTKVSNLRDACCQDLPGQEVCSAHFCVDGFSDCFCICEAKLCGQRRVPHPRRAFGFCHGEEGEILSEFLIPFLCPKLSGLGSSSGLCLFCFAQSARMSSLAFLRNSCDRADDCHFETAVCVHFFLGYSSGDAYRAKSANNPTPCRILFWPFKGCQVCGCLAPFGALKRKASKSVAVCMWSDRLGFLCLTLASFCLKPPLSRGESNPGSMCFADILRF